MTVKNESNIEPPAHIDDTNAEITARCQSLALTSRRNFLVAGMTGATGLALVPLARRLVAPGALELAEPFWILPQPTPSPSPSRKRGFWATFLGILDLAASLFGFGGVIPAIAGLIQCVSNNGQQAANSANSAFTAALASMRTQGFALNVINRPRMAFSEIGIRLVSSLIQSLPCTQRAELGPNRLNQSRAHHLLLPPSSDLRFHTPALKSDNLNGVTLHFDYTNARNPRDYDLKAAISAPTTHALTKARNDFELLGYRGELFRDFILTPTAQLQSERPLGTYDANYKNDIYKTKEGATFEINYQHESANSNQGTGAGDITFCGLVDRSASNKRLGLRRIRYEIAYPPCGPDDRDLRTVDLKYQKGYTEFRAF